MPRLALEFDGAFDIVGIDEARSTRLTVVDRPGELAVFLTSATVVSALSFLLFFVVTPCGQLGRFIPLLTWYCGRASKKREKEKKRLKP